MPSLLFDGGNAVPHHAAVDLELAFAFSEARADSAAHAVRCEMGPHAAQPRVKVFVLREPHLQAAFLGGRMQSENIQDEGGPVDHLDIAVDDLFQVCLLRWAQLVIEHDEVGSICTAHLRYLLSLSRSDEGSRIGRGEPLRGLGHHFRPNGVDQPFQLFQRRLDGP